MNHTTSPSLVTTTGLWSRLAIVLLGLLASCGGYEDKRIRELLNEKGFGSRADGEATRENYLGGNDLVQFIVPPEVLMQPGAEQLSVLQASQPVGLDGTIFVPLVGPVYALGKTEADLAALLAREAQEKILILVATTQPSVQEQLLLQLGNRYCRLDSHLQPQPIPTETECQPLPVDEFVAHLRHLDALSPPKPI